MNVKLFAGSTILLLGMTNLASAQATTDQMKIAYEAARNQVGVIGYCQDKGFVDADVVAIQQKMIALIPPPADTSGGDAAEALGRKGTVSAMGTTQDIEAAAKAQGSSAQALCQAMGAAIKQAGGSLPK